MKVPEKSWKLNKTNTMFINWIGAIYPGAHPI